LTREKVFSEDRARFYIAEITLAMTYLHERHIIYRDLKLENLLLDKEGHIKITDFGLCKEEISFGATTTTFCGTPEYLAPEVLEGNGYGKAVDWWSFGTLMFEMLTGLPPFYSQDVQQMYSKIMKAKLIIPESISPEAKDLLVKLLERNPDKRLTDPSSIKAHPWFSPIDWDKLLLKEMTPPYMPPVKGKADTSLVDPSFTSEDVTLTITDSDISSTMQQNFRDFTYVGEGLN